MIAHMVPCSARQDGVPATGWYSQVQLEGTVYCFLFFSPKFNKLDDYFIV